VTNHDLDAKASKGDAYCMSTTNVELGCAPKAAYKRNPDGSVAYRKNPDGSFYANSKGAKVPVIEDIKVLDPSRPRIGNWGNEANTNWKDVNYEAGPVMTGLSKIPGMNAMAVFHDTWSFETNMDPVTNVVTIVPAAVLTYVGTGAPAFDLIQKTNINSRKTYDNPDPYKAVSTISSVGQQNVSYKAGVASNSMLCVHGNKSRHIIVDAPSEEPGYACRVIYQNERGTSVPWYANNEKDYCYKKAVALTVKQIALGWSCYAQ